MYNLYLSVGCTCLDVVCIIKTQITHKTIVSVDKSVLLLIKVTDFAPTKFKNGKEYMGWRLVHN